MPAAKQTSWSVRGRFDEAVDDSLSPAAAALVPGGPPPSHGIVQAHFGGSSFMAEVPVDMGQ